MTKQYLLMNKGNVEACYIDNGLGEVKESLKDFFLTAFGEPLADGDERLEDTFHFCSQSRFDSIDTMTFEELKEELDCEFNWGLVELDNKNELIDFLVADGESREHIEESIAIAIEDEKERV